MNKIKQYVSYCIALTFIILAMYYYFKNPHALEMMMDLKLSYTTLLLGIQLLITVLAAYLQNIFIRHFNVNLNSKEWMGLYLVNSFLNLYIPAQGATILKALYLKKKHGLVYTEFLVLFSGILFLSLYAGLLSYCMIYFFIVFPVNPILRNIFYVALVYVTLLSLIGLFPEFLSNFIVKNSKFEKINLLISSLEQILFHKKLLVHSLAINFSIVFCYTIQFWVAFKALDYHSSFWQCMIIAIVPNLTLFIMITPGNIGLRESLIVMTCHMIGIEVELSLASSIIIRCVSLFIQLLSGPMGYLLLNKEPQSSAKPYEKFKEKE